MLLRPAPSIWSSCCCIQQRFRFSISSKDLLELEDSLDFRILLSAIPKFEPIQGLLFTELGRLFECKVDRDIFWIDIICLRAEERRPRHRSLRPAGCNFYINMSDSGPETKIPNPR